MRARKQVKLSESNGDVLYAYFVNFAIMIFAFNILNYSLIKRIIPIQNEDDRKLDASNAIWRLLSITAMTMIMENGWW